MADITGPPIVSFASGFFSGRVESTLRESAQQAYYNLTSVDAGPSNTGATITSGQNSQALGYQIQASNTWFSTTASGGACVLPQTNRPTPFAGLLTYIWNAGANPINCYPHPNDPSNQINGQTTNTPVVLGVRTVTAFVCFAPGIWQADGIGEGYSGSFATIVSQGNIAAAGTSQGTATAITQAIVNFTSGGGAPAGGTLPPAKAGMQVWVGANTGSNIQVYGNGSDTINGTAGSTGVAQTNATVVVYTAPTDGAWLTK